MHYLSKKYLRNCHQTERKVISESIKVDETIFRPRSSKYNVGFQAIWQCSSTKFTFQDAIYHKNCYSNVVNERNLGRAIERQKRAKKITTQHLFHQREGDQHHFHYVQLY